ncbi:helix-turn-helix domain-containing protein [Pararhodonellum marinum]|uniref:helix-turn-helix domain-containing protein n=1 Tax=Pararhodonellum marinum TaxID=2755358 RepID=UPI0018904290|nr:AraC family transcriptional regulator [Pararhodonellum marinum]
MNQIVNIHSVSQLHQMLGFEKPAHPLITVIDYSKCTIKPEYYNVRLVNDFYLVSLKTPAPPSLQYGRQYYDFEEGTLMFMAPGQAFSIGEPDEKTNFQGWVLFFHPDLILPFGLSKKIKNFGFFSYSVSEALHVSDEEKKMLDTLIQSIQMEYQSKLDQHSHAVICTAIEQLLNYSKRFYSRQFITRQKQHLDLIAHFEKLIQDYLDSDLLAERGMPQVDYFSGQLHLSSGYLSDLLKKETGKTVKEYLHLEIIERAKYRLLNSNASVNEIAYGLGFEYPQYFNRLFKSKVGMTPLAFRNLN